MVATAVNEEIGGIKSEVYDIHTPYSYTVQKLLLPFCVIS